MIKKFLTMPIVHKDILTEADYKRFQYSSKGKQALILQKIISNNINDNSNKEFKGENSNG